MTSQESLGNTYPDKELRDLETLVTWGIRDILKIASNHLILTRKEEDDTNVGIGGGGKSGFVFS